MFLGEIMLVLPLTTQLQADVILTKNNLDIKLINMNPRNVGSFKMPARLTKVYWLKPPETFCRKHVWFSLKKVMK